MANGFKKDQRVQWHWASGIAHDKVIERFDKRVQRTIKGARIVRRGTPENPAYLIEQEDGDRVLKRGSELSAD